MWGGYIYVYIYICRYNILFLRLLLGIFVSTAARRRHRVTLGRIRIESLLLHAPVGTPLCGNSAVCSQGWSGVPSSLETVWRRCRVSVATFKWMFLKYLTKRLENSGKSILFCNRLNLCWVHFCMEILEKITSTKASLNHGGQ